MYIAIMAGGKGTRFWPLSKGKLPKQLLKLTGTKTMLQLTVERILPVSKPEKIFIVTNIEYGKEVSKQLPYIPKENILKEPEGRNTAACIGLASVHINRIDPSGNMVVLPSDHFITEPEGLRKLLSSIDKTLRKMDCLFTIGFKPTYPETGYGYIQLGDKIGKTNSRRIFKVIRFTEKPDHKTAKMFLRTGKYLWNSGIFVWKVKTILNEIKKHLPNLFNGLMEIEKSIGKTSEHRVIKKIYNSLGNISIDYGIMEKSSNIAVIPSQIHWKDIGNWNSLEEILKKDSTNNISVGKNILIDTNDSIVFSTNHIIATLGVKDLIIVQAGNAVFVCHRKRDQDVKKIISALEKMNLKDYL
ncbi:MAG: hypothetical protein A3C43_01635 [Candidatus Schekmanbacteria bacterium RIFCSPHIGHO2_02_FULL_38_11]|uniref:mannose-1-phosphate guanylyltransferase n=1 Tax=Candidatus Schekmanbacteria bacterium RIFCSPLOWO2_12_FULL_38_15 TaxID=1817883 RepID=A0A1F7SHZ7_9BACT|nr:MAG: hypothetical protein A2043_00430 [Candidatus Schekmanbacteria bacterium GWA2_38_9]OGL50889.1 MAG: hypothetical protein A3H37_03510 [Candidatus Schekmanbacteria bacterium RIFCSPLOWO2_02_FULL_38_14]OGL53351.1 MAG: hypothetical protein A3G31_07555 [Candidatus Schekmanbacteria bacterium RIFCSPLOWO2_12_FULL_38_15]OGL54764.1 MAG: hypothetical protein A3C43_01635 [Candidatus Schekmanbacteria bacterium RIFCSPHIGHO2_02_FULL_38_11]